MPHYKSDYIKEYHKKTSRIITTEQALDKAMSYCSRAEHCTFEVKEKLSAWGINEQESKEQIIKKLKKEQYIDDTRYASSFIHEKITYNRWGRIKIATQLRSKKIEESIYRPLLQNIDRETYTNNLNLLLERKWSSIKGKNNYERKQKLIRFVLGKGYELNIAIEHIEKKAL